MEKIKVSREDWRDIRGYVGIYQISDTGRVKSLARSIRTVDGRFYPVKEKIMKSTLNKQGYETIVLKNGDKKCRFRIHRLVAETFIPNQESKPQVNHIDGNKLNNNIDNLEWCTASENQIHAFRTGLRVGVSPNKYGNRQGSKHYNSKLNESKVLYIRENCKKNGGTMTNVELSKKLGVSKALIGCVVNNKNWTHI